MRELRHPNLLPLLAAFVHQHHLWMVTPYYRGGSLRSIIEYGHPGVSFIPEYIVTFYKQDVMKVSRRNADTMHKYRDNYHNEYRVLL